MLEEEADDIGDGRLSWPTGCNGAMPGKENGRMERRPMSEEESG